MKIFKLRKGITLLEVSIAMAFAAVMMISVYSQLSNGLRMQRESISLSNAVFLAKIKMAQVDSSTKLESNTTKGEIPGYIGYKYEVDIKEEEMDLLKLAETGGQKKKPPEDLMGKDSNAKFNDLMKKRGSSQTSKTGGIIKVFKVKVTIIYPEGGGEKSYEAETFKSSTF